MPSTQEILSAAEKLGKMIGQHDTAQRLEAVAKRLESDVAAQRVLNDYNRFVSGLQQKEQEGKPIEIEEKRKLEQMQRQVFENINLRDFQMAQMDYLDLMRKVEEAMDSAAGGGPPPGEGGGGGSPVMNPNPRIKPA